MKRVRLAQLEAKKFFAVNVQLGAYVSLVKMFAALILPTHLCYCLIDLVGMLITK